MITESPNLDDAVPRLLHRERPSIYNNLGYGATIQTRRPPSRKDAPSAAYMGRMERVRPRRRADGQDRVGSASGRCEAPDPRERGRVIYREEDR
jgi:hypothetical protein